MRAFKKAILLTACAARRGRAGRSCGPVPIRCPNRVTKVTYTNGHSVSYGYDAAGNITSVITVGRSSAQVSARLARGADHPDHGSFTFHALKGETVTPRFEADPAQAGLGKYIVMSLKGRADKSKEDDDKECRSSRRRTMSPGRSGPRAVGDSRRADVGASFTGRFTVNLERAGGSGIRYQGQFI